MKIKFYNNQYVKRILSGITGLVILAGANSTAKALNNTIEITNSEGKTITITIPEGATSFKVNTDGSVEYTLGNVSVSSSLEENNNSVVNFDYFMPVEEQLTYADYQKMCEEQYNEILAHQSDIEKIQVEDYRNKDFKFNTEKLMHFVKSFVYITNHDLFDNEAKSQILSMDVTTDIGLLIGNDYTAFTNFVDGYNQAIIRKQEIEESFDKSKLISCEYSFGNATDREEYIYARDTWFNSVKNGRAWNDDYYTLYCYISNYSGVGLNVHYIDNASLGARASIRRTVGVDFKESHKVVFDEYMKDKANKNKFTKYFEDVVTYALREDAKQELLININNINNENEEIRISRENGDFSKEPTNLCEDNLETLIFYYSHICDDVDDFLDVVKSLQNEFSKKTK